MPKSDTSQSYTYRRLSDYGRSMRITIALKFLGWSSKLAFFALWIAPELRGVAND